MLAAIRIRGRTGVRNDIEKTAKLLRLTRINHLVLLRDDREVKGMLEKAKDYITWGEIDPSTLEALLRHRLLMKGHHRPTEKEIAEYTGKTSFRELADALLKGEIELSKLKDSFVPVFRLHPPRGGYESIRKPYGQGGSSGYRGESINTLILKMLKPGVDLNGEREN